MARWNESWESSRIEDLEILAVDDNRTISLFKMIVRGKGSGIELAREDGVIFDYRNGKIVRIAYYNDQTEALEAAGQSEGDIAERGRPHAAPPRDCAQISHVPRISCEDGPPYGARSYG